MKGTQLASWTNILSNDVNDDEKTCSVSESSALKLANICWNVVRKSLLKSYHEKAFLSFKYLRHFRWLYFSVMLSFGSFALNDFDDVFVFKGFAE